MRRDEMCVAWSLVALSLALAGCPGGGDPGEEPAPDAQADAAPDSGGADASDAGGPADTLARSIVSAEVLEGEDGARRVRVVVDAYDRTGAERAGLPTPSVSWGDGQELAFGPAERAVARYQSAYTGGQLERSGEDPPTLTFGGVAYELTGPTTVAPVVPEAMSLVGAVVDPKLPYLTIELKEVVISSYSAKPSDVDAFTEAAEELAVSGLTGVDGVSYVGTSYVYEADAPAGLEGDLTVTLGGEGEGGLVVDADAPKDPRIEEVLLRGEDVVVWWSLGADALEAVDLTAGVAFGGAGADLAATGADTLEERVFAAALEGDGCVQRVTLLGRGARNASTEWACDDACLSDEGGLVCGDTDHFRPAVFDGFAGVVSVGELTDVGGAPGMFASISGSPASRVTGARVELREGDAVRVVELALAREFHAATFGPTTPLEEGDPIEVTLEDRAAGTSTTVARPFVDTDASVYSRDPLTPALEIERSRLYPRDEEVPPPVEPLVPAISNAWFEVEGGRLVTWVIVSEHQGAGGPAIPRAEFDLEGATVPALTERAGQAILAAPRRATPGAVEVVVPGPDGVEDLVVEAADDSVTVASGLGVNLEIDTRGPNVEVRVEGTPGGLAQLGFTPGASPATAGGVPLEAVDYRRGWYAEVEGIDIASEVDVPLTLRASLGEDGGQEVEVEATVQEDAGNFDVTLTPATVWIDDEVAILTRYHETLEDRRRAFSISDASGRVIAEIGEGPPTTEERIFALEFDAPVADGDALALTLEGLGASPDESLYQGQVDATVGGGWVLVDVGVDDAVTRWARVDRVDGRARVFYSETTAGGALSVGSVGVGVNAKQGDEVGDAYVTYEYGLLYEIVENDLLEGDAGGTGSVEFGESVGNATYLVRLGLGNGPGSGGGRVWPMIAGFGKGTKKSTSNASARPELL